MITSHMNGFVPEASAQVKGHRERAVDCPGEEGSLVKSPQSSAHMERIQHYQEELRKRREEDGRGRVDIDPNASLRLKKLAENPKVGIDNPTFEGKEKASTDSCPQDHVAGELEWGVEREKKGEKERKTFFKKKEKSSGVWEGGQGVWRGQRGKGCKKGRGLRRI